MAKIDILLPYWGDVELLKLAVDSVYAQSEPDWHLYVLDDHDPSDEAFQYFAENTDPRVTYIRHPKNLGITKNFNYAVDTAQSPFCTIMGYDDILLPNYIERALATINRADFYQPGVQVINESGNVYVPLADRIKAFLRPSKPGMYGGERLARSLSNGNWLYFPSIMWRTETLTKYRFNERYKIAEDLYLEFEMLLNGAIMMLDNDVTFQYRRFANSLSSAEKKKGGVRFNEEDEVYDHFAREFRKKDWSSAARAARLRVTSRIHTFLSSR